MELLIFKGSINRTKVIVLINSCYTHKFISYKVAQHLGLPITKSDFAYEVELVDGQET